jgi:AcrR family transcriptional regulator
MGSNATGKLSGDERAKPGRQQRRVARSREAILDAAVACYQDIGLKGTTAGDIIGRSGLGRTTFYRHFTDQDEVLNQALLRDFAQMISDFLAQRFAHDDPAVQIVEDMCWFCRQLRSRPVVKLLFRSDRAELAKRLTLSFEEIHQIGLVSARPSYELARSMGLLREGVTLEGYLEWTTFVLVSIVTVRLPFSANEFTLRDTLRTFLVPALINVDAAGRQENPAP